MSLRIALLTLLIVCLALYAWRNWFIALCGLIVLTAAMGHPDMPRTILGVQGLNPWNILLVCVLIPWWLDRRRQGLRFDAPRTARNLFLIFIAVVVVAYLRAAFDLDSFPSDAEGMKGRMGFNQLTSDYLINSIKYVIPGVLLFDGCRTKQRLLIGLTASILMAVVYAGIVVRTVPITSLQETGTAEMRQRHRIGKQVGFHANSVAMICAAGFWATAALSTVWKRKFVKVATLGVACLVAAGLAVTRSRGGYVAFMGVGLIFAVLLWRYLLLLLPLGVAIVVVAFPGISQRVMAGVGVTNVAGDASHDVDTITAGRATDIWPSIVDQIEQSPVFGYGRLGILRTPAHDEVKIRMQQPTCPTHPHNAYLELLLDGGLLSAIPVLVMYVGIAWMSFRLCLMKEDRLIRAVGAVGLACVSALFIMALSGQTFFPKENSQMAWCVYGLVLRAKVGPGSTTSRRTGRGSDGRSVV